MAKQPLEKPPKLSDASTNPPSDTHRIAVGCQDVGKYFGVGDSRIKALRGATLDVRTGELLILSGPSGCGKTTLISIISGILNLDEGRCLVFDHDVSTMNDADLMAFRATTVGFVFQQFNLIPTLNVAENVAIPLMINGMERKLATQKAGDILERVGLGDKKNVRPLQLSGGQQQRVAIARAIIHNPKLVVCDEPTSALDSVNGNNVMALLKSLVTGTDNAMIVVTHDSRVFKFADRIASMEDGHILGIGPYERGKYEGH